ncbi:MAG: tyrosine-type recombinase/integrase [Lysinibacillus sp.]
MRVDPIRDRELLGRMKTYLKKTNIRNYIMFLTGIHCGYRISDILQLQVKHVKGWDIRGFEKKTGSYRQVRMPKELKKEIRAYIVGKDEEEYLFKSRKGQNQPITPKRAYEILRELADDFELEHIGTHTLRKTYGYQHYRKFKNVATLMKALNHSSQEDTLIYIGVIQEELDEQQGKIDW